MNFSAAKLDRKRIAIAIPLLVIIGVAGYSIATSLWTHPEYRAAQEAARRRDFESASAHLQKCLQENPADRAAWLLAAQVARRQGKLAVAADQLDAYTRLAGQTAEGKLELALIRIQSGKVDEADGLLAQNPSQKTAILEAVIEGYFQRLVIGMRHEVDESGEMSLADYQRGHQAVDQWLEACPDRVDQIQGHLWRGKLYAIAKEHPKALAVFRKVLELDPDHRAAHENLGLLLVADAPREAVKHLRRALEQNPNFHIAFNLAVAQRALGELAESRKTFDELLATRPNDPILLVERALVALDERQPREAETFLQHALRASPEYAEANLLYSQCLQQDGRTDDAKRHHDKYLEIQARAKKKN